MRNVDGRCEMLTGMGAKVMGTVGWWVIVMELDGNSEPQAPTEAHGD